VSCVLEDSSMQFVFSIRDVVCYSPVLSIKIVTSTTVYRLHNAENIHFLIIVLCWVSTAFNGPVFCHFGGIYCLHPQDD